MSRVDYAARRARVAAALAEQNNTATDTDTDTDTAADALLVTTAQNIRYLTGFSGSAGVLLISADGTARFATDSRYTEQIRSEIDDTVRTFITRNYAAEVIGDLLGQGPVVIGYEDTDLTVAALARLRERFSDVEGLELVPRSGIVEEGRRVKDAGELEAIAVACAAADAAWEALLDAGQLAAGRTERQVAADLEWHMRQAGSDGVSFDTIVAAGPNGALPHYHAGDRELQNGDLVVVDFGCYIDGYASDCTRTVGIGRLDDWAREIYQICLRAQQTAAAGVRAGAAGAAVDALAREIITEAGYGEQFGHSLGHGVGLDVHEAPALSTRSTSTLLRGDIVTVEPGIYLPGRGGVRIEDTLAVTDGAPKVLTCTSKELQEL